jgi:hypothetical protein
MAVASAFSRKDACGGRTVSGFGGSHFLPAEAGSHTFSFHRQHLALVDRRHDATPRRFAVTL